MGDFDLKYIGSVFLILLVSVILSLIETLMTIGSDFSEFRKMFGKKKLVFWIIVDAVVFGIVDYLEIVLGWRVPLRKVFALLFFLLFAVYCYKQCKDAEEKRDTMILLLVSFVIIIAVAQLLCVLLEQW